MVLLVGSPDVSIVQVLFMVVSYGRCSLTVVSYTFALFRAYVAAGVRRGRSASSTARQLGLLFLFVGSSRPLATTRK